MLLLALNLDRLFLLLALIQLLNELQGEPMFLFHGSPVLLEHSVLLLLKPREDLLLLLIIALLELRDLVRELLLLPLLIFGQLLP